MIERLVPGWTDIQYGTASDGTPLHLSFAAPPGPGPFPCVLGIHGGGFRKGTYASPINSGGKTFVERGYAVFSINYRLVVDLLPGQPGPVGWRGQWDDVLMAVDYIRTSPNCNGSIVAYGGSAGGNFSALLAAEGIMPGIGLSPVTDLTATDGNDTFTRDCVEYAPTEQDREAASPVYNVGVNAQPFLMTMYANDSLPPSQYVAMLNAPGIAVTAMPLPGKGHAFDAWNQFPSVQSAVLAFLDANSHE